ncbi:hypothetical protein ABKA04_002332 [Annulohypoxylon sp. FPYF3050]
MPPPSPQHQNQKPPAPHPAHQMGHYGGPPAPRAPPVNLGPPSAFPSARELPALNSIPRTGSTGGSMSISSMLGGPPPAREPTPGHPTSFQTPVTTSAVSGPAYAAPVHASPRMQTANEYASYNRRPQTPDQGRPFDARDHRGNVAGSPPQGMYGTPEMSRYNTPQAYPQRGPPMPPAEERREPPGRIPPTNVPPRPSSQPRSYHGIPPRPVEMGRGPPPGDPVYGRREETRPPGPVEYNPERPPRAMPYEEQRRFIAEREQMNREADHLTEGQTPETPETPEIPEISETRETRATLETLEIQQSGNDLLMISRRRGRRMVRLTRVRDQANFLRLQLRRTERIPLMRNPLLTNAFRQLARPLMRYLRTNQVLNLRILSSLLTGTVEEGPPPPSVAYNGGPGSAAFEAGRPRVMDEGPAPTGHQRNFLGIQEINRKGRVSPLPQAVQGAQPQLQGPAGEPGIKSEFGRMFSGIGSGVRGIGVSSPVPTAMQAQFSNAGPTRRDDEHPGHEMLADAPVKTATRGKRRKAKDDDGKGDDDSTGRNTPVGRAKRPKTHAHHHHHQSAAAPSSKSAAPGSTIIPKPRHKISSQAVLDSVADRPRKHLGDVVYQVVLKPSKLESSHSKFGYSSNPRPLPMDVIKGNENSTLTVKIPRVHLSPSAREEITARRAVWGTDVYTDDSDVVAACIHAGWIRGEWGDDVDVDLLDLYKPATTKKQRAAAAEQPLEVLTSPPASGPVQIPADRDLHVTLLVLPALDKYSSSTRFGIQSREFGGTYNGRKSIHDGISFMILNVRWVDGAAPQSRLRGKARRERIRKAMTEMNRSQVVDIGEKELLSKKATTRDASIDKEKSSGKAAESSIGEGNKENRPAISVLNNSTPASKQEKPIVDTKMDLDDEAKEKIGSADSQSTKTADTTTTTAVSTGKEPENHGSNESTDVST